MSQLENIRSEIQLLIDSWLEAWQNGEEFPVPFDIAWQFMGYSRKDVAKRKLKPSLEGKLFHRKVEKTGGRGLERIYLTIDGFKHLCLLADTEQGEATRQYFIETENKWKLLQQHHPQIAHDIELMRLSQQSSILDKQIELSRSEAARSLAEQNLLNTRHLIVSTMPEHMQKKILGYTEIERVEYRDRIVKGSTVINDGSTINKTELCQRYSILTRNGKPDYKRLNAALDRLNLPNSAWEETDVVQTNREFKREFLPELDRALYTAAERQLWLGEI